MDVNNPKPNFCHLTAYVVAEFGNTFDFRLDPVFDDVDGASEDEEEEETTTTTIIDQQDKLASQNY